MNGNRPKKVCLVSLGCAKNLVDSEVMLGILKDSGLDIITDESDADIIIVNTCGFIGDAKEESIDAVLSLAGQKKTGRCRRLIVTGCLSQRYKDDLMEGMPEVDCFIGTGEYHRIGEAVREGFKERVLAGLPAYIHDYATPRLLSTPGSSAYVKVAEGCSNRCTYCAIPEIRGKFRSRTVESIVKEASLLAGCGIKEINLIAQDTTSYGADLNANIADLLKRLVRIKGIEWIRLLYLYPGRISDELVSLMRNEEKILRYIDLPLQHISPRILKAMNRRYTRADVESLIERLRRDIDGVIIRTTMIAGFPGETNRDFEELLSFVKDARFERLGVFKYSREEGTPAFDFKKQVSEKIKGERMDAVMEAQREISLENNRRLIKRRIKVLIEGTATEDGYPLKGRVWSQAPDVDGATFITKGQASMGEIIDAVVTGADDYDIFAERT